MGEKVYTAERLKYLTLLAEGYPTVQALCTEIVNLEARLALPKGTEHFMSDIHGEYEAFCHILNNCSGVIREKVNMLFSGTMTGREISGLCTLIYYPREKLKRLKKQKQLTREWYRRTLQDLIALSKLLSSKYTREQVRRAMPEAYAFLLDELLHAQADEDDNQVVYHDRLLESLIDVGESDRFIVEVSTLIKHLAVARLHVVGDIFDRGARADSVLELLEKHHAVDITWGNHDILWMGAAAGSPVCCCAVVRNCLSYRNMDILERGYGIPLRPLTLFAEQSYPGISPEAAALHAVTLMMFKLEGQLIARNPDFGMEDRRLLHRLDRKLGSFTDEEGQWPIRELPPVRLDQQDPYRLSQDEEEVVAGLVEAFRQSMRLRSQVNFLYDRGRLYRKYNNNLLFHGCVPMTAAGDFRVVEIEGRKCSGRALMDALDAMARRAYFEGDQKSLDFMWYLWCADYSSLCGRKIKTFQRYFTDREEAWREPRDPYYTFANQEEACVRLLEEFGLRDAQARIINGHTPIRVTHGESPIKAGGKCIVIDGGFCRAYQKTTGIAGYTLISNSHGMRIVSHQPFTDLEDALSEDRDIHSQPYVFATWEKRKMVADTDHGQKLQERIADLHDLLEAVRQGQVNLNR